MTDTTPQSLLQRLRENPDEEGWKRLVDLYTPLLRRWLRQSGVKRSDADDLLQEILTILFRKLPSFEHNQQCGAFRCWLHTILSNRLCDYWRARQTMPEPADSAAILHELDRLQDPASDLNQLWDREHDVFLARRVLQVIEKDFLPDTWQAFRRVFLDGVKPAVVAAEMGLSVNAVHLAKWRVLRRARREITGLID